VVGNSEISFTVFLLAGTTGLKLKLGTPLVAVLEVAESSFGFSDSNSGAAGAGSTRSTNDSARKPSPKLLPFMRPLGFALARSLFNPLAS